MQVDVKYDAALRWFIPCWPLRCSASEYTNSWQNLRTPRGVPVLDEETAMGAYISTKFDKG